jgi:hypothetical protein
MDTTRPAARPVFIVGMNGSGTTMMLDLLDSHPELFGFRRETLIVPHFVANLASYGDLADDAAYRRLWRDFLGAPVFRFVNGGESPELPADWRERPRTLAAVVDGAYRIFAERAGKTRWCEKTPMHVQHVDTLHGVFPDACFIHMVRDGRSCAASLHRRWKYHPGRTLVRWKRLVPLARRQAEASGAAYLEVRYEELTDAPEPTMRRVCEFLGVAWDPRVLETSRVRSFTGTEQTEIVKRPPTWQGYFAPSRLRLLERIGGRLLHELGYETSHPEGDWNPPAWRLRAWTLRDDVYLLLRAIRTELTVRDERRWDSLGNRIRSAIRQRLTSRS